jgi:uncharacterized membrane protein
MAETLANIDWTSALMVIGVVVSVIAALFFGQN